MFLEIEIINRRNYYRKFTLFLNFETLIGYITGIEYTKDTTMVDQHQQIMQIRTVHRDTSKTYSKMEEIHRRSMPR